jgi:ubiquinone/menaquinone biosynthesis C-methylase UbiE
MNQLLRGLYQDLVEMPGLRGLCGPFTTGSALEIGCGNGMETRSLCRWFAPSSLTALDPDPAVLERAQRRRYPIPVSFVRGGAEDLAFADRSFDTVFCLGVLHHLAAWRTGVREIARVLRPGGRFVSAELSIESFRKGFGPLMRVLTDHPYAEMYTLDELREECRTDGLDVRTGPSIPMLGITELAVMVCRKPGPG